MSQRPLVTAPSHLTWRQGVHIQMMNIHRNSKAGDIIKEYRQLQRDSTFTDTILVARNGHRKLVHSLVLLANSEFLKRWVESTFASSFEHVLILPDVDVQDLEDLIGILYGMEIIVSSNRVRAINELIDMLGITVDVPFRTTESDQTEQLPMCCWHCDESFTNLDDLKFHLSSHQRGGTFPKKQHKCSTCKKNFPSMWRLRQHFGIFPQHANEARQDDQVIGTFVMVDQQQVEVGSSNQDLVSSSETEMQASENIRTSTTEQTTIQSDHLYSAKKLSKQEAAHLAAKKEQQIQLRKIDHLYSAPSSPSTSVIPSKVLKNCPKSKKKHTIQALGHSYAAARPRKLSGSMTGKKKRKSIKMFPCDQCDKEFPQPYRLNRHIREVHEKERRHFCRHCEKSFFKLTSKDRHELTHTSHDTWKCSQCSKLFRDQSSLNYHTSKKVCQKMKPT